MTQPTQRPDFATLCTLLATEHNHTPEKDDSGWFDTAINVVGGVAVVGMAILGLAVASRN